MDFFESVCVCRGWGLSVTIWGKKKQKWDWGRETQREKQRVSAELFWSWCLSTLINAHRETPDGKGERKGESQNKRVEKEIWGEEYRGRRWSEGGRKKKRVDLTHGDDERAREKERERERVNRNTPTKNEDSSVVFDRSRIPLQTNNYSDLFKSNRNYN